MAWLSVQWIGAGCMLHANRVLRPLPPQYRPHAFKDFELNRDVADNLKKLVSAYAACSHQSRGVECTARKPHAACDSHRLSFCPGHQLRWHGQARHTTPVHYHSQHAQPCARHGAVTQACICACHTHSCLVLGDIWRLPAHAVLWAAWCGQEDARACAAEGAVWGRSGKGERGREGGRVCNCTEEQVQGLGGECGS